MSFATSQQVDAPGASTVYRLENVGKVYLRNALVALKGVSINLAEGSFSSVIGSSGCGKSTLLKIMAGLLPATSGTVELRGSPVTGPRPDIGMMFQQATLLPWRTTIDNILLPISMREGKAAARASREKAEALMELVGIKGFEALTVEALRELRQEKDAEIETLQLQLDEQREANAALDARLQRLEAALAGRVR